MTDSQTKVKVRGRLVTIAFVSSVVSAFVSTNVYWLLTVTYAKPVKDFGEKGVLSGFEAASFLISKYGFDAYLYGLSGYYMVAAASCFFLCLFGWKDGAKIIGVKAALLSIFSAAAFYFFDFKIYFSDSLNGQRGFAGGYKAIHEVGGVWLLVSIFSLSLLFFSTLLVNTFFCRLFVRIK